MAGKPSLRRERELLRAGHRIVAGIDEVGRGAIAGPVTVGVVMVSPSTKSAPSGVRDSKLLTPTSRERLYPTVRRWAAIHAVGHASCDEIDQFGLTAALRLAAMRALAQCPPADVAILDGSHDWLTQPAPALFDVVDWPDAVLPQVHLQIKADMTCSSVAAASVLAKVERDRIMVALGADDDRYGWCVNKGYTTAEHSSAIRKHGMSEHHRRSWDIAAAIDLREEPTSPEGLIDIPSGAHPPMVHNR